MIPDVSCVMGFSDCPPDPIAVQSFFLIAAIIGSLWFFLITREAASQRHQHDGPDRFGGTLAFLLASIILGMLTTGAGMGLSWFYRNFSIWVILVPAMFATSGIIGYFELEKNIFERYNDWKKEMKKMREGPAPEIITTSTTVDMVRTGRKG